ncbi:gamma-glutamyl-gamma-aminobutyrate hydrolase family protein [Kitasatospora sp. NPDC052868]|uniref:gamma-glutamyl-gamma-aminobutyrate hydrolase family protein n=1 Tax=Kitasatospora sp. NPDC052868 TaxID=3364060 RepID=UPI0037CB92B7
MTVRPLIGITTYLEEAAWSVWRQPAAVLPGSYLDAVSRAGGTPVLLPPQDGGVERLIGALDGLLLAGGADIDPARYGAEPHPRTGSPQPHRDRWESDLLAAALDRDLPVLGICRGLQLLNVALGGDLRQHLPDQSHQDPPATYVRRGVVIRPDSRLGEILGPVAQVSCYHHQAVGRLGTGLRATAWSADENVEALELPGRAFTVAVQWHPETDPEDPRLFEAFTAASCKEAAR